jgi:hypothetical protein
MNYRSLIYRYAYSYSRGIILYQRLTQIQDRPLYDKLYIYRTKINTGKHPDTFDQRPRPTAVIIYVTTERKLVSVGELPINIITVINLQRPFQF